MKITPLSNLVQLDIKEAQAGVLDTSSRDSAVEYAEVIAIGDKVTELAIGDKVFVKAWAVDIITHEEQKFYFVDINSNGILAKVN